MSDGARRDRHRPNRAPMVSTAAPLLCAYHAPPVTRIWNTVERRFELATPPGGHGLSRGPIELQMPMANVRRRTPSMSDGLTHRHLLPLDPRNRNPGTNCYESSMRFELPGNPRAQISMQLPPVEALHSTWPGRPGGPALSGITSYVNSRVKVVSEQANVLRRTGSGLGSSMPNGEKKAAWNPQSFLTDNRVKEDLLAVMEKVKRASVFFADSQGAPAAVVKEEPKSAAQLAAASRKKYNSPGSGGEQMSRQKHDEMLNRRLQDYRERPEEFREFKKQVKEMQCTSLVGTTNKLTRNIGMIPDLTPSGKARKANQKRQKADQKKQAMKNFKANQISRYEAMCKEIELKHINNQLRAEKTIADRYADKAAVRSQQKSQLVGQTSDRLIATPTNNDYSVVTSPEGW